MCFAAIAQRRNIRGDLLCLLFAPGWRVDKRDLSCLLVFLQLQQSWGCVHLPLSARALLPDQHQYLAKLQWRWQPCLAKGVQRSKMQTWCVKACRDNVGFSCCPLSYYTAVTLMLWQVLSRILEIIILFCLTSCCCVQRSLGLAPLVECLRHRAITSDWCPICRLLSGDFHHLRQISLKQYRHHSQTVIIRGWIEPASLRQSREECGGEPGGLSKSPGAQYQTTLHRLRPGVWAPSQG